MNKYLQKIAGVPISKSNIHLVAKTYVDAGMNFAKKQQAGKAGTKDLMKLTSTANRLNQNLPKRLAGRLEKEQLKYLGQD
jgi:hypothetical protein